jgi:hypothetical protein
MPKNSGKSRDTRGHALAEDDSPSALDWITRYAVPLVGIVGAALYGVLRLAYLFFYLRLRASPDEVGYGYSQVLADELIGAIELVIIVALILIPIAIIAILSIRLVLRVSPRWRSRLAAQPADWAMRGRRLLLVCFIAAIPVVLIGLPIIGLLEGEEAVKGYTVRNVYPAHFIALPVLAVEAVPARIYWVAGNGSSHVDIRTRQCLLYLGQANGISVFYDVHSEESVRLPSADIVTVLQDTISVPIGC